MKICIFGAGAIGGFLGLKLSQAGADVSLVARGPHLAAIQSHGLMLIEDEKEHHANIRSSENPEDIGEQDYVILTLKAHSIRPMV